MSNDGTSIFEWVLKGLTAGGEYEQLNKSFEQEWYTVPEAHSELNKRGAGIHPETLRRFLLQNRVFKAQPELVTSWR